jgi:hypothetical protein
LNKKCYLIGSILLIIWECLANSFIVENTPLDKIISYAREQNDHLVKKMNIRKKREEEEEKKLK